MLLFHHSIEVLKFGQLVKSWDTVIELDLFEVSIGYLSDFTVVYNRDNVLI